MTTDCLGSSGWDAGQRRAAGGRAWMACVAVLALSALSPVAAGGEAPAAEAQDGRVDKILDGGAPPKTVADLRAMQQRFRAIAQKVLPCTVGVRIGGGSGSGVIVSEEGHVLTAAHVAGRPGRDVTLILHDGRRVKGKTLGANYGADAAMIKITDEGRWPHCELGNSAAVKLGAWCMATGHPAGYQPGRTPPVRVGRVQAKPSRALVTDCMLVGGDSGGPLFDMHGRVIGIHSRIGGSARANVHVPVDAYRQSWDRLAKGEAWGQRMHGPRPGGPYVGVVADPRSNRAKVLGVQRGSPAEAAGIHPGDVIATFDGKPVKDFAALAAAVRAKKPGNKVTVEIQRGGKTLRLELTIGKFRGPAR